MNTATRIEQDRLFVPEPEHVRLSSLGFDTVVADYYWLQALQLVGGERGDTRKHAELIGQLIDVVTTLDPWVGHPYRFAAVWLTGSEEAVRDANRLLERGIAYDPRDWRNRYHLGFNHFFYLEENRRAADVLEEALPLEGVPNYLGALVARLRLDHGGLEMAAGFLSELVRNAQDEYARAEYLKALDEIETERRARYLDAAREEYWRRHGEDIESVEDLRRGAEPIVRQLPAAHPQFDFTRWVLDEASGQIVSSYYGKRYELHTTPRDAARRERWRKLRAQNAGTS
jgi:tetratricopeptide (TPR) repeat protein